MQITCEKCSTSYQVDDKLIPAGGAPVQCTKCGNTFTAFPPQTRAPAKTVMMFASDAPVAPVPATGAAPAAAPPPSRPGFAPPPSGGVATPMPAPTPRAPAATVAAFPAAEPVPASSRPASLPAFSSPAPAFTPPAPAPAAPQRPSGTIAFAAAPPAAAAIPTPVMSPVAPTPAAPRPAPSIAAAPTPVATPMSEAARPTSGTPPGAFAPTATTPQASGPAFTEPAPQISDSIPSGALDQPINTSRPGRMTQMFFNQGEAVEQANIQAQKVASGEANRKPGQTQMFMQAAHLEESLVRKSNLPLYLAGAFVLLAILGLVGALYGPALIGPPGADRQAVEERNKALELVKKDDLDSLNAADKALADILARKPRYVDAKADRAMVQQFLADDRLWKAEQLKANYDYLFRQVERLSKSTDPADAAQRAKEVSALSEIRPQYEKLGNEAKTFEDAASKLVGEAAKDDPNAPAVIRARGIVSADHDMTDAAEKFSKKYLHEINKQHDAWAELILAEAAAAGKPSEDKRQEGLTHSQAALALDSTLVRARYLRVRIDTMNGKEAEAKDDVSALTAANKAHTGGAALFAGLEDELARKKAEKDAADAKLAAAQAAATPAAKKGQKPGKPKKH